MALHTDTFVAKVDIIIAACIKVTRSRTYTNNALAIYIESSKSAYGYIVAADVIVE